MDSPFPGMDPYLESHWRDVHTRMMTYIGDQIQDQLPTDLVARVEESVAVDFAEESRLIAPDVSIVEESNSSEPAEPSLPSAVSELLVVLEEVSQARRHVKIVDLSSGERVVAAIEVLSPTNKSHLSDERSHSNPNDGFGASLREALPVVPIPLRPRDQDVQLDLQEIVRRVYDQGRYWKLNYQTDPELPFSAEDAAWVDELLRTSSRRHQL